MYTAFNRPRPANSTFSERFARSLREQARYGTGAFGKVRYAAAEHTRPFQCRCGTWLQADPWSFGWVDVAGIAALVVLHALVAAHYPWAKNGYVFAIPIGLWVGYRITTQVAVSEVPASALEEMTGQGAS